MEAPASVGDLPPGPYTVRSREEVVGIDGAELTLHLALPLHRDDAYGAILLVPHKHGLDAHSRALGQALASRGLVVLTADLLARYGGAKRLRATPHPSARGIPDRWHVDDLRAAVNFLEIAAHGLPITVVGEAFGCEVAVGAARADERLTRLITLYGPRAHEAPQPTESILAIYAEDAEQLDRATRARALFAGWRDAHVVTVARTQRPLLDHLRLDQYSADAAKVVLDHIAAWIAERSPGKG